MFYSNIPSVCSADRVQAVLYAVLRDRDTKMRVFELKKIDGVNPRVGCFYDGNPLAMDATPVYDSADMTKAVRK